jgi:hypothetical protein
MHCPGFLEGGDGGLQIIDEAYLMKPGKQPCRAFQVQARQVLRLAKPHSATAPAISHSQIELPLLIEGLLCDHPRFYLEWPWHPKALMAPCLSSDSLLWYCESARPLSEAGPSSRTHLCPRLVGVELALAAMGVLCWCRNFIHIPPHGIDSLIFLTCIPHSPL